MELFTFIGWALLTILGVTLLWPPNLGLMFLACKVRVGWGDLGYEPGETLGRVTLASVLLAGLSLAAVGITYFIVEMMEMQPSKGTIHLVVLALWLTAALFVLHWSLALEDLAQALSVLVLYLMMPALPVLLFGWLFGLWSWLRVNAPWLAPV